MEKLTQKQQHILALTMLSLTAIIWGWGFVLNSELLNASFEQTPILLNAVRFGGASVVLLVVFATKLRFNKQSVLCSLIGGTFLFFAFWLQTIGLKYTTPAHNGFFTASYIIFVPFFSWAVSKKRPRISTFVGIGIAVVGLAVLNLKGQSQQNTLFGDLITLVSALIFALQIVWTGHVVDKQKADHYTFTTLQLAVASVWFVVASLIFESSKYNSIEFNFSYSGWRMLVVALLGTAFAYFSQTFAQINLTSSETSLILGCESPIGAIISILIGLDTFTWGIVIGGMLVFVGVIVVEVLPNVVKKKSPAITTADVDNSDGNTEINTNNSN